MDFCPICRLFALMIFLWLTALRRFVGFCTCLLMPLIAILKIKNADVKAAAASNKTKVRLGKICVLGNVLFSDGKLALRLF